MEKTLLHFRVLVCSLLLVSCGGGGGSSASCIIPSVAGEPDLTGSLSYSSSVVTAGEVVAISIPIDADTVNIGLYMIGTPDEIDYYLETVVVEAVTPGDQIWQYAIDTTGYTPGTYSPDIEVCSDPNSCTGISSGIGVIYSDTFTNVTDSHFIRSKYWDNGAVNENGTDACITIPYLTVN